MDRPLRILLVESALEQAEMVAHELLRAGFDAEWCVAREPATFRRRLGEGTDLVLSELRADGGLDLAEVLRCARTRARRIPVLAVSLCEEERLAALCRRLGADGWVSKRRLAELPGEARRVLGARAPGAAATPAETPLRVSASELAERLPEPLLELAADGRVLYANPSARRALGLWGPPAPPCRFGERLHASDRPAALRALREALASGEARTVRVRVRGSEGRWALLDATAIPYATPEGAARAVVLARPRGRRRAAPAPAACAERG